MSPCVLLDLDGTLTDSRPGIVAGIHHALRALGHEPDPAEDLTWVIGPGLEHVIARVLAPYGDDRTALAVAEYRQYYGTVGLFQNAVYPGIPEALASLRAHGFDLLVATAKRTRFARPILEHFGLAASFRGIYGSEDDGLDSKPELIAHILAREMPSRAVMVGDRAYDVAGAHANGLRAIGVAWGYGGPGELAEAGVDAMVASPADLPAIVAAELAP